MGKSGFFREGEGGGGGGEGVWVRDFFSFLEGGGEEEKSFP